MKRLLLALVCVLPALSLEASSSDSLKIRVMGCDNYPPFEFINEDGLADGFNIDLLKAMKSECRLNCEIVLSDWSTVVNSILQDSTDMVMGLVYSASRAEKINFGLPTCVINRVLVCNKNLNYKSLADLQGKKILVQRSGWLHDYLLEKKISDKIYPVSDMEEALNLYVKGGYDAIVGSNLVAYYFIKQKKLDGVLKVADLQIEPQRYSMAFSKSDDELLYRFNLALQQLKLSGEYDKIYDKWFGVVNYDQRARNVALILIGAFVVSCILLIFIYILRRKVHRATNLLFRRKNEMELVIQAGNIQAWSYNIASGRIAGLYFSRLINENESLNIFLDKILPEDLKSVSETIESLKLQKCKNAHVTFRLKNPGSEDIRIIESMMLRVDSKNGAPIQIVGTLRDVTLEQTFTHSLEDYRLKTSFMLEASDMKMRQYDLTTKKFLFIDDNKNTPTKEFTRQQYLEIIDPADRNLVSLYIDELDKGKKRRFELEFRIKNDSGDYVWHTVTTIAYKFDSQGSVTSYLGILRNVSKWKHMADEQIALRNKAEASNKLKSAFLANMSHEIRTPLNAIVGFSELMAQSETSDERQMYNRIIKTNNELLLQLINDILDLSKIEAGFMEFHYSVIDFPVFFDELAASMALRAPDNVQLININPASHLDVYTDRTRLSQVITNFVTNAFKFTHSGSVTMQYEYVDAGLKISVTDTGIGIAKENQEKVFERFEKLDSFAQGTGLGLSICKAITEAMNGKIGLCSQQGKGSTFWIWIPSSEEVHSDSASLKKTFTKLEPALPMENSVVPQDPEKPTILIAEDMDANYMLALHILQKEYNVVRAEDGVSAVEKAKTLKPDIILMDMKMPQKDGLEATREIRLFDQTVPIVALTAYTLDTDRRTAMNAGCNGYLSKPFKKEKLVSELLRFYRHKDDLSK